MHLAAPEFPFRNNKDLLLLLMLALLLLFKSPLHGPRHGTAPAIARIVVSPNHHTVHLSHFGFKKTKPLYSFRWVVICLALSGVGTFTLYHATGDSLTHTDHKLPLVLILIRILM